MSWLLPAENPVPGTEISFQTAAHILQDFMKGFWDYTEIDVDHIGWGYPGSLLGTRSGKSVTLRCIPVIETITKEDTTRRVMRFDEIVRIDIYVRDEKTLPAIGTTASFARSAKLEGIVRYVQGFVEANTHAFRLQGISGMENVNMQIVPADNTNPNSKIYHAVVTIRVWHRQIQEHDASWSP
jgi:hypothetical protein